MTKYLINDIGGGRCERCGGEFPHCIPCNWVNPGAIGRFFCEGGIYVPHIPDALPENGTDMTRRSFIQIIGAVVGAAMLPWGNPARKATLIGCGPRTCHWTGEYSADFDDARNWQDGDVPTDGDSIVVATARPMVVGLETEPVTITRMDILHPNARIGLASSMTLTELRETATL